MEGEEEVVTEEVVMETTKPEAAVVKPETAVKATIETAAKPETAKATAAKLEITTLAKSEGATKSVVKEASEAAGKSLASAKSEAAVKSPASATVPPVCRVS